MEKTIGIYHKDCSDGTTAAAILVKRFPNIELFALEHGYSDEAFAPIRAAVDHDTTVYVVDATFGARELADSAKEIIVLDHHIGAKEEMEALAERYGNLTYIFDVHKSGASLAWTYFYGEESIPELVRLVEDFDIWTWQYGERTKYAMNALLPYANNPEEVLAMLEEPVDELLQRGKVMSDFSDYLVEHFMEKTEPVSLRIGNHIVPAYNSPFFASELGNRFAHKHEQAVAVFSIRGMDVRISFRGLDKDAPSALELAQILGGGGHEKAAGARVPLETFFEMVARK